MWWWWWRRSTFITRSFLLMHRTTPLPLPSGAASLSSCVPTFLSSSTSASTPSSSSFFGWPDGNLLRDPPRREKEVEIPGVDSSKRIVRRRGGRSGIDPRSRSILLWLSHADVGYDGDTVSPTSLCCPHRCFCSSSSSLAPTAGETAVEEEDAVVVDAQSKKRHQREKEEKASHPDSLRKGNHTETKEEAQESRFAAPSLASRRPPPRIPAEHSFFIRVQRAHHILVTMIRKATIGMREVLSTSSASPLLLLPASNAPVPWWRSEGLWKPYPAVTRSISSSSSSFLPKTKTKKKCEGEEEEETKKKKSSSGASHHVRTEFHGTHCQSSPSIVTLSVVLLSGAAATALLCVDIVVVVVSIFHARGECLVGLSPPRRVAPRHPPHRILHE